MAVDFEVTVESEGAGYNVDTTAQSVMVSDSQELNRLAQAIEKSKKNRHRRNNGRNECAGWKERVKKMFSFSTSLNNTCIEEDHEDVDLFTNVMSTRNCWSGSLVSLGSIVGTTTSSESSKSCLPCNRAKRVSGGLQAPISNHKNRLLHSSQPHQNNSLSAPASPRATSSRSLSQPCQRRDNAQNYPEPVSSIIVHPVVSHPRAHTQVDYVHHLVHDLPQIFAASFYWGVMDRYEAEHLLEGQPEGTFLLRDSAQLDFLFSVSFRRYSRTLHARIEHTADHSYTFDSYDDAVHSSRSVCELIDHYKDPSKCMYFEPLMSRPLSRNFPLALEDLCRGVICAATSYDGVAKLPLPAKTRERLRYYHYKIKLDSRHLSVPMPSLRASAQFVAEL